MDMQIIIILRSRLFGFEMANLAGSVLPFVFIWMPVTDGIRQNLKRASRDDGSAAFDVLPETSDCPRSYATGGRKKAESIGAFMAGMFVTGRFSARDLQEGAAAASSSNSSDSFCSGLAKIGNSGRQVGNLHRDACRNLGRKSKQPPIYQQNCIFWDHLRHCQIQDVCNFMLPHEILDHEVEITGVDQWLGLGDNTYLEQRLNSWKERTNTSHVENMAAMGLWADSAAYNTRDSLFVFLFNVLSGIHRQRFWCAAFSKRMQCQCGCKGRHSYDSIYKVLIWPLGCAYTGVYPSFRADNTSFADRKYKGDEIWATWAWKKTTKIRGEVPQHRGNWQWMKNGFDPTG